MKSRGPSRRSLIADLAAANADRDAYDRMLDTRPAPTLPPPDPVSAEPAPPEDEEWFDREVERTFTAWPAPDADRDLAVRRTFDRLRGRVR